MRFQQTYIFNEGRVKFTAALVPNNLKEVGVYFPSLPCSSLMNTCRNFNGREAPSLNVLIVSSGIGSTR
jgi:hypothetical protein